MTAAMPDARAVAAAALLGAAVTGCKTPAEYRHEADQVASEIIESAQIAALGETEPFTIERPADTLRRRLLTGQRLPISTPASLGSKEVVPIPEWPDPEYFQEETAPVEPPPWSGSEPLMIDLVDALRIAARNSREYQTQKELVFQTALALDLERQQFRTTWFGLLTSDVAADLSSPDAEAGSSFSARLDAFRRLEGGTQVLLGIGVDLVKLLTMDRSSSLGVFGDATVSIPLMRGSGKFVVTEPLKQAERDVVYSIYDFDRFKRVFAVDIAAAYLDVLVQQDIVANNESNYRELVIATRQTRRWAQVGRLPEIQVDQARQDELSSRNDWISAREEYQRRLDALKVLLGLPTDAHVVPDPADIESLFQRAKAWLASSADPTAESGTMPFDAPVNLRPPSREEGGPLEIPTEEAILTALENRRDMRVAVGRIFDSQRVVAVAADNLRADLTLLGTASVGDRRTLADAQLDDARLRFEDGFYSAFLGLDLPLERTLERNLYRNSLIAFEQAVREAQRVEDTIKFEVRSDLRDLLEARETILIQSESVDLARERVRSTTMFLRAGRAEVRDLLEAQQDLLDAQNALTESIVDYRIAELAIQRDMGVLVVDENGLWVE